MRVHCVLFFLVLPANAALFKNFNCPDVDDDGNQLDQGQVNDDNTEVLCIYETAELCFYDSDGSLDNQLTVPNDSEGSCPENLVRVPTITHTITSFEPPPTTTHSEDTTSHTQSSNTVGSATTTPPPSISTSHSPSSIASSTFPSSTAPSGTITSTSTAASVAVPPSQSSPAVPLAGAQRAKTSKGVIAGIAVAVVAVTLATLLCVWAWLRRRKNRLRMIEPRPLEEARIAPHPDGPVLEISEAATNGGGQGLEKRDAARVGLPHAQTVEVSVPPARSNSSFTLAEAALEEAEEPETLADRVRRLEGQLAALAHPEGTGTAPPGYTR
ncbi:hypothetical protein C8R46DRAFT_1144936 [Mycena filopes]|nr:hypothetical protein C8R46DRAFT_1144936 [Mycena filopes]